MLLYKATYSNSHIHSHTDADQHIRSSFEVQFLAEGHFNMQNRGIKPATFRQQMLALPLSHSRPPQQRTISYHSIFPLVHSQIQSGSPPQLHPVSQIRSLLAPKPKMTMAIMPRLRLQNGSPQTTWLPPLFIIKSMTLILSLVLNPREIFHSHLFIFFCEGLYLMPSSKSSSELLCLSSSSFSCSSDNASWWFNGICPLPWTPKTSWNPVNTTGRTRRREERKGKCSSAVTDSEAGGCACERERDVLFEPPVVLWPGCREVEALPAHWAREEITSVTLCHSHNYIICKWRYCGSYTVKKRKEKTI